MFNRIQTTQSNSDKYLTKLKTEVLKILFDNN